MAIFVALRSPELEVLGLTTTFGNVHTALATRNALHLVRCWWPVDLFRALRPRLTLASDACTSVGGCWKDRHPRGRGIPCNNQGSCQHLFVPVSTLNRCSIVSVAALIKQEKGIQRIAVI